TTTDTHPLSLHDALPISQRTLTTTRHRIYAIPPPNPNQVPKTEQKFFHPTAHPLQSRAIEQLKGVPPWQNESSSSKTKTSPAARSEEHTSELQSRSDLVC